jgi:hypothetical protein
MTSPASPQIDVAIIDQYRKIGSLDPTTMTVGLNAYIERGTESGQHSQNIHSLNRLVTISEKLFKDQHMKKEVLSSRWMAGTHLSPALLQSYDSYDRHFYSAGVHTTHSAWSITDFGSGKDALQYGGPYRLVAPLISFSSSVTQVDSPYWNLVSQQIIENSLYRHTITDLNQSMQKHTWNRTEQMYTIQTRNYVKMVEDKEVVAAGNHVSLYGDTEHYYDCCYIQVGKDAKPPIFEQANLEDIVPYSKTSVKNFPLFDFVSPWYTKLNSPYGNYIINAHNDIVVNSIHQSIRLSSLVSIMSSTDYHYQEAQKEIHLRALKRDIGTTVKSKIFCKTKY